MLRRAHRSAPFFVLGDLGGCLTFVVWMSYLLVLGVVVVCGSAALWPGRGCVEEFCGPLRSSIWVCFFWMRGFV